jgi:hypothetical protein
VTAHVTDACCDLLQHVGFRLQVCVCVCVRACVCVCVCVSSFAAHVTDACHDTLQHNLLPTQYVIYYCHFKRMRFICPLIGTA